MIITSIKFQNFYSFKEKVGMNFLVNENAPHTNHFGLCDERTRFSKVSSIFGANASGKTNLMLGFNFLHWFISKSFSYSDEGFPGLHPFETTKENPSVFEVEFYIEDTLYKYSLEIKSKRVLLEVLESRRNKRFITLYSRKYMDASDSYEFEGKNVDLESSFIKKVRPNASVISTAKQYNHKELTKVRDSWFHIFKKVRHAEDDFIFFGFADDISKYYFENKDYFQRAKEFLRRADLGLADIQIKTKEKEDPRGNKRTSFYPYGIHRSRNKKFEIPFFMESGGTLHLYEMLSFIFPALQKGSVCLIDEIEKNLHPNILPSIINLFVSKETNPKQAQLICTTHMPTVMTDLSKYQLFFVEKNKECESEAYRLDEVEGVRSDDNFFKKYLAGAYGGIPDIDI